MKNVRRTIKFALAAASICLLCSCATKPHVDEAARPTTDRATGPANSVNSPVANSGFKNQQVVTPHEEIEKDKLLVSYGIKAIPDRKEYLVKVSMVFRNLKDQNVQILPVITLSDSAGNKIEAYSKKGFLKRMSAANVKAPNSGAANSETAHDRIKWANAYWLKSRFTIPPNGIEIGELVFHASSLDKLPMTLTVKSARQEFVFTINNAIPVVSDQAK